MSRNPHCPGIDKLCNFKIILPVTSTIDVILTDWAGLRHALIYVVLEVFSSLETAVLLGHLHVSGPPALHAIGVSQQGQVTSGAASLAAGAVGLKSEYCGFLDKGSVLNTFDAVAYFQARGTWSQDFLTAQFVDSGGGWTSKWRKNPPEVLSCRAKEIFKLKTRHRVLWGGRMSYIPTLFLLVCRHLLLTVVSDKTEKHLGPWSHLCFLLNVAKHWKAI